MNLEKSEIMKAEPGVLEDGAASIIFKCSCPSAAQQETRRSTEKRNMKSAEITNVVPQTESAESTAVGLNAPRKPAHSANTGTRPRYALLIGIALLSGWLAYTVITSLNEINAEMDVIRATCSLPLRSLPTQ
jgi:hypothetical protein